MCIIRKTALVHNCLVTLLQLKTEVNDNSVNKYMVTDGVIWVSSHLQPSRINVPDAACPLRHGQGRTPLQPSQ